MGTGIIIDVSGTIYGYIILYKAIMELIGEKCKGLILQFQRFQIFFLKTRQTNFFY